MPTTTGFNNPCAQRRMFLRFIVSFPRLIKLSRPAPRHPSFDASARKYGASGALCHGYHSSSQAVEIPTLIITSVGDAKKPGQADACLEKTLEREEMVDDVAA
jgi:hypothetical protein